MSGNTALPLLWPQLHVSSVPPFKGTLIDNHTLHIPEKISILDDAPLYFVLCSCSHLAFVLLLSLFLGPVAATKLRSWLDTRSTFMEGSLPSARVGHGFATTEDGQVYAFGGQGQSGKKLPAPLLMCPLCLAPSLPHRDNVCSCIKIATAQTPLIAQVSSTISMCMIQSPTAGLTCPLPPPAPHRRPEPFTASRR